MFFVCMLEFFLKEKNVYVVIIFKIKFIYLLKMRKRERERDELIYSIRFYSFLSYCINIYYRLISLSVLRSCYDFFKNNI